MRLFRVALFCLLSLAAAGLAAAQGFVPESDRVEPARTERVRGVSESSYRFFPPVVHRMYPPIIRPIPNRFRQPQDLAEAILDPIPLGEAQDYERISGRGALWPAIGMTGWVPPDPTLAVGPNHVVVTVNVDIAWYTKDGSVQFQQDMGTFFASTGSGGEFDIFDPKCFYDRINNRFVVVALEQSGSTISKFLIAVSDDNNPNGTWHKYRLEARWTLGTSTYWADYPGFGYNKDGYLCTANLFRLTGTGSGYGGVEFMSILKSSVLSGGAATVTYFRIGDSFGVQPAHMNNPTVDRIYMFSDLASGSTTTLRLHSLTNISGTPTLDFVNVSVPAFQYPTGSVPAQSVGGRNLDTLDGRILTTSWRNGRLAVSQGIRNGTQNVCRWYEINTNNYPTGAPTVAQSGNVAGGTGQHFIMPAIHDNELGDITMLFTRCSTSIIADLMAAGRKSTDAAGTFGAPTLLQSSTGTQYGTSTGTHRWGDYFAVETDPNDDTTFWGVGMIGDNPWWLTVVRSWTISAPIVLNSVTLDSSSVIGGVANTTGHANMSGNAPTGGYVVNLSSTNPSAATVPATVTVPAGSAVGNFAVTSLTVANDTTADIRGVFRGVTKQQTLTVLWASKVVPPTSFAKLGDLISGNLASLAAIDDDRMQLKVSALSDIVPPIRLQVEATCPIAAPTKFEFLLNRRVTTTGRLERIFFWDWTMSRFDLVSSGAAPVSNTSKTVTLTTDFQKYIQAGTLKMRARIDVTDYLSDITIRWETFVDQSAFKVWR